MLSPTIKMVMRLFQCVQYSDLLLTTGESLLRSEASSSVVERFVKLVFQFADYFAH
jgi:hypothetical protein